MKTTNRLLSLFAAFLFAAVSMADVVYEPLVVDSGFNRDVIAETTPLNTQVTKSYLLSDTNTCYWSMATQSVIRTLNTAYNNNPNNTNKFTTAEIESTAASGWPDNHDTIRCILDARGTYGDDLFWIMAPYDQKNVLTIRPKGGKTQAADSLPDGTSPGIQNGKGTLKFKKVGCYDRVYFLIAAAKENGAKNPREVNTIVHYTDGDTTKDTFTYGGLSGKTDHNVRRTNIYEGKYAKNTHIDTNSAYIMAFDMRVNSTKLISYIEFKNDLVGTGVMIFAVTGRTADIDAPAEESTEVNNLGENSFKACWEAIADAASYRLDVAEDPDFQHILADYNNLDVSDSTCQEVAGLFANNDYYWRVRSVNADGGQSASSAPRCVRTAGNNPPETSETSEDIETMLAGYAGYRAVVPSIKIHRTLCRNGYFNTLCLPFNMNADQIAASPIAGARVFEYVRATKTGEGLDIEINGPIDHIVAGTPYLVNWEPTTPEWIGEEGLVFENVNIVKYKGDTIGNNDQVQFIGNIGIANLVELDQNNLFLGANNTLYWPEGDTRLRGFRSYFKIPTSGANAAPKHTPARIVKHTDVATDIDMIDSNVMCENRKVLRDGILLIKHNGVLYNAQGQRVLNK